MSEIIKATNEDTKKMIHLVAKIYGPDTEKILHMYRKIMKVTMAELICHEFEQETYRKFYSEDWSDSDFQYWFEQLEYNELIDKGIILESEVDFFKDTMFNISRNQTISTESHGKCSHYMGCCIKPKSRLDIHTRDLLNNLSEEFSESENVNFLISSLNIDHLEEDHLLPKSRTSLHHSQISTDYANMGIELCKLHNRQKDNSLRMAYYQYFKER